MTALTKSIYIFMEGNDMQGNGSVELPAEIEQSWNALMDPEILKECIMGCKEIYLIDKDKYQAEITMGVAAIKGNYTSTIELLNLDKPNKYTLIVHGKGNAGSIDATANITLEEIDENNTMLTYEFEAEVGGKVAMVGQRMLGGVSKMIINGFFKKISRSLKD